MFDNTVSSSFANPLAVRLGKFTLTIYPIQLPFSGIFRGKLLVSGSVYMFVQFFVPIETFV